jgi:hypothetical protein
VVANMNSDSSVSVVSRYLLDNRRVAVRFPSAKEAFLLLYFKLQPQISRELHSSGLLRSETTTGCITAPKGTVLKLYSSPEIQNRLLGPKSLKFKNVHIISFLGGKTAEASSQHVNTI